jgi:hypothetical protein
MTTKAPRPPIQSFSTATAPGPVSTLHDVAMHVPSPAGYPAPTGLPPAEGPRASADEAHALAAAQPVGDAVTSGNMPFGTLSQQGIAAVAHRDTLALMEAKTLVQSSKETLANLMTAVFQKGDGTPDQVEALRLVDEHVQAVARARALIEEEKEGLQP